MAWYAGMPENRPASGSAVVVSSIAMDEEATKLRTRAVLLTARGRPHHVDIGIGDVSRVVVGCIRMPPSEMRTTRHNPEDFMIVFNFPHQWTLALRMGTVRVKGVTFAISPWTEHAHGSNVGWWYHVRVAIENLPVHAWKLDMLAEVLGEVYFLDKIDCTTYRQQSSDIIYCWAWMWFPDLLPRAQTVTFFRRGGKPTTTRGGPAPAGQVLQPDHPSQPRRGLEPAEGPHPELWAERGAVLGLFGGRRVSQDLQL